MKNHSLKLPTIWSLTCLNRNNGGDGKAMLLPTTLWRSAFWRTMLLRTRAAAVLLIICILAGTSLYGSEGSITTAVLMDGSNQKDRAPPKIARDPNRKIERLCSFICQRQWDSR